MSESTQKKKLCWNCEGRVSFTEENCPFCGVYLSPSPSSKEGELVPPYKMVNEEDHIPASPYASKEDKKIVEKALPIEVSEESASQEVFKKLLIALSSLILGTGLLLFAIVLALFSENGSLILRWEATYWYAYLILALPMLFLGWCAVQKL